MAGRALAPGQAQAGPGRPLRRDGSSELQGFFGSKNGPQNHRSRADFRPGLAQSEAPRLLCADATGSALQCFSSMNSNRIAAAAQTIWNYLQLNQPLAPGDCILVLGSHDLRVARYGAELFWRKLAPFILFSGKRGHLTEKWKTTEAQAFARLAIRAGVPKSRILLEPESTNTGENVLFSKRLLAQRGLRARRLIVVHKPYMERRVWATFKKVWPEQEIIVTSPPIPFADYPNRTISKREAITIMLGDLQRIRLYAREGFQIPQRIPRPVIDCYRTLVRLGYTDHLRKKGSRIISI